MTTPIVALDVSSAAAAFAIVDALGDDCTFYKVGSQLFTAEGPSVVRSLRARGLRLFVDLKLHDIPNTVEQGARELSRLGADLLTVHASGGTEMVAAAVRGAGPGCGVLAVTVLTSLDGGALGAAWGRSDVQVEREVLRLAALAAEAGARGVVCSGHELEPVRDAFGDRLATLVPGIRFAGGAAHDQSRIMTPGDAAARGATYIVLGRAVTGASDPRAAMARVRTELAGQPSPH